MHPDTMKHKASLWFGDVGTSIHITDVYWEGDITQQELREVADQISLDWQTVDLELDPSHPCHGRTYRLTRSDTDSTEDEDAYGAWEVENALAGQYVWVHCCQLVLNPKGDLHDEAGRAFSRVFSTLMFCTEFTSFDDTAQQCDENFGAGEWDEYELYLDDALPTPVASFG